MSKFKGAKQLELDGSLYTAIELLGKGGAGEVILGEREKDQVRHSIKLILQPDIVDPIQRSIRICKQQGLLTLPNVSHYVVDDIGAIRVGSQHLGFGVASTFIEGKPVTSFRFGEFFSALRVEQIFRISQYILPILENLGLIGVVHRDLKPSNMLLTQRNDIPISLALIDFDLATESGSTDEKSRGTALYAPTEVAYPNKRIKQVYDIYSLAMCLIHALCGDKTFTYFLGRCWNGYSEEDFMNLQAAKEEGIMEVIVDNIDLHRFDSQQDGYSQRVRQLLVPVRLALSSDPDKRPNATVFRQMLSDRTNITEL